MAESGVITELSQNREVIAAAKPKPVSSLGWTLSVSRPTPGASTIDMTAIGTSSSAARVGERSRTSWA